MKVKSLIYTSLAASLLFASCNLNEQPVFDDATQAFIAFSATSGNVFEAVDGVPDTLEIELYCASVAGITASVQVVPTDTAYPENQRAKEGVDFKIEGDSEIHFDADNRFATIKIVAIDNNVQGGNKRFDLVLTSPQGCNLGANKRYAVSILDDEDPVNMLIGSYTATAESAFQGEPTQVWSATIERDFESEDVIYIQPICEFVVCPVRRLVLFRQLSMQHLIRYTYNWVKSCMHRVICRWYLPISMAILRAIYLPTFTLRAPVFASYSVQAMVYLFPTKPVTGTKLCKLRRS